MIRSVHFGSRGINGNCRMDWFYVIATMGYEGHGGGNNSLGPYGGGILHCALGIICYCRCVHTANNVPFVRRQMKSEL